MTMPLFPYARYRQTLDSNEDRVRVDSFGSIC